MLLITCFLLCLGLLLSIEYETIGLGKNCKYVGYLLFALAFSFDFVDIYRMVLGLNIMNIFDAIDMFKNIGKF